MENETYESLSHWGMFRLPVTPFVTNAREMSQVQFIPLSAYKERIDTIPKVEVAV